MIISRDEALIMLEKWSTERTPVTALLIFSGLKLSARINGFITSASADVLKIENGTGNREVILNNNCVMIAARYAQAFHYAETKDLALSEEERSHIVHSANASILCIRFAKGFELSIFETGTSIQS